MAGRMLSAITTVFGARELTLLGGLGMFGYGLWLIWIPGAFVGVGLVLLGLAIFGLR